MRFSVSKRKTRIYTICHGLDFLFFLPKIILISGQLQQIAKDFYNLKLKVKVLDKASSASNTKCTVIVTYRLDFDNRAYVSLNL